MYDALFRKVRQQMFQLPNSTVDFLSIDKAMDYILAKFELKITNHCIIRVITREGEVYIVLHLLVDFSEILLRLF